jgi:hypothetical protein
MVVMRKVVPFLFHCIVVMAEVVSLLFYLLKWCDKKRKVG